MREKICMRCELPITPARLWKTLTTRGKIDLCNKHRKDYDEWFEYKKKMKKLRKQTKEGF